MSDTDDLLASLVPVAMAFQRLGVRYYIGGSVASTIHGAIRSTMDVDLVTELQEDQIEPFIQSFGDDFYVSSPAVRDAVKRKSCFNLIHLPTAYEVDVFVSRGRPFDQVAMARAVPQQISADDPVRIPVATVEDSIIAKLEWFRLGDESSQRQWDDVSRLVALHGPALDIDHMRQMAASVGVTDLLNRLLSRGKR